MLRRNFLKNLSAMAVAFVVAPTIAIETIAKPKPLTREQLIAAALETPEGKRALAQAMVEPIGRALEYHGVGRKLLLVDELPQGALARYERDVASVQHIIKERGVSRNG